MASSILHQNKIQPLSAAKPALQNFPPKDSPLLLDDGAGFCEANVKAPGDGKAGGKGKDFVFLNTRSAGGSCWRGFDECVSGRRNGSIPSAVSAVFVG